VATSEQRAEYKQVTVLFADVVGSMDIAAAVGAERLREIMGSVFDLCAAVVQRYGGTVDKFTGDGIMALFGAPIALEDHAFRACLAALDIQHNITHLPDDSIELQLRVGLNSGQVIAGEIGSGSAGYTAIGDQVGMAQRMESAAPPGGVMLSPSTARLVEGAAQMADTEWVHIKGVADPVPARRLLGTTAQRTATRRDAPLVGRRWEMAALAGILDEAVDGHGGIVRICGPAGIGKSRTIREITALAATRGIEVFSTSCESHTREIPFHTVARLLRTTSGTAGLEPAAGRAQLRAQVPGADPEDLLLLDDLLGIAHPDVPLPRIDPDARRRRLAALVNTASLARTEPALYIVEDIHWIDEVSEAMLADFLTVIPQTRSTVMFTFRPEYEGSLSRGAGQTIGLAPLSDSQTTRLVAELLGPDRSVAGLIGAIAERAAGNPFFAEELARDLLDRDVLQGQWGAYTTTIAATEVSVPATLQATIAARIDRLPDPAKRTLHVAAVIGSRFDATMLVALGIQPALNDLISAELVEQTQYTPHPEYAFHHPLIRAVAYEAQLKSSRAELHRRLAAAIDQTDENAALIATHLQAASDLLDAYAWHMRAGTWLNLRDLGAGRASWVHARQIADRLPEEQSDRLSMRIAPRALLCGSGWMTDGSGADTGFDELRELCVAAGDKRSLAIGMAGVVVKLSMSNQHREASQLASEFVELLESTGDTTALAGTLFAAMIAKYEAGEMTEALRLAQRVIDLADGDPRRGNLIIGSPLAIALGVRGFTRASLAIPGWREDLDTAEAIARPFDPTTRVLAGMFKRISGPTNGFTLADRQAQEDAAELLEVAEQSASNPTLTMAQLMRGTVLLQGTTAQREAGFDLFHTVRDIAVREQFTITAIPLIDTEIAAQKWRAGDLDEAIELSTTVMNDMFATGEMIWHGRATTVLVESLLARGTAADLREAHAAIERLAAVPVDPGFVLHELPLLRLRALLAQAHGDDAGYRDFRDRYRKMATDLEFEGHMATAEAMP
jgi:adenylate cyclase